MNMRDVAIGIAITLSVVTFNLALWPAVADAGEAREGKTDA